MTDNPPIRIYVHKLENRIAFRIKEKDYLKCLTPETLKLFGSTKCKITINENSQEVPHLEMTEVVIVYSNIVNNDYQNIRSLYTLVPSKFIWSIIRYFV